MESQIITFLAPSKHIVPDVEVRCNSCLSSFHKLVSRNSMVHMSAYEGNTTKLGISPKPGSCAHDDLDYLWTVYSTDREFPENSLQYSILPLNENTTTTGNRTKYLIIKQGVLDNDKFYHFNLSLPYDNEFNVISSYILKPNKPPHGGECVFRELTDDANQRSTWDTDPGLKLPSNNSTGFYAATTKIEFHCSNWHAADADKPLTYTLRSS